MLHVDEQRFVDQVAEVNFNCASCGETHETDAVQFRTVNRMFGNLTVWVSRETAVQCPACEAVFRCSDEPSTLSQLSAQELSSRFRLRIGLVEKFLVVAGWIVICAGPVSLVLFLVAFFMIPKAVKGWRLAAMIGLGLASVSAIIMFGSMLV